MPANVLVQYSGSIYYGTINDDGPTVLDLLRDVIGVGAGSRLFIRSVLAPTFALATNPGNPLPTTADTVPADFQVIVNPSEVTAE